ncbi:MAG: Trm112 family protein [Gammaproteobacteria bacterium]|nr:Trm112 family protein [Gammaproteobacteria bacterium]
MMDKKLLNILVCPESKAPLKMSKDGNELICKASGLAYPIRDDIPVLLVDEARQLSEEK